MRVLKDGIQELGRKLSESEMDRSMPPKKLEEKESELIELQNQVRLK